MFVWTGRWTGGGAASAGLEALEWETVSSASTQHSCLFMRNRIVKAWHLCLTLVQWRWSRWSTCLETSTKSIVSTHKLLLKLPVDLTIFLSQPRSTCTSRPIFSISSVLDGDAFRLVGVLKLDLYEYWSCYTSMFVYNAVAGSVFYWREMFYYLLTIKFPSFSLCRLYSTGLLTFNLLF